MSLFTKIVKFSPLVRSTLKTNTTSCSQRCMNSGGGTIEARPYKFNWGIIPVTLVSVPCIYVGGLAAKRGAEFLEEWNIFVPEDDDE